MVPFKTVWPVHGFIIEGAYPALLDQSILEHQPGVVFNPFPSGLNKIIVFFDQQENKHESSRRFGHNGRQRYECLGN